MPWAVSYLPVALSYKETNARNGIVLVLVRIQYLIQGVATGFRSTIVWLFSWLPVPRGGEGTTVGQAWLAGSWLVTDGCTGSFSVVSSRQPGRVQLEIQQQLSWLLIIYKHQPHRSFHFICGTFSPERDNVRWWSVSCKNYMWPSSWWKGGIGNNKNAFKRFPKSFERVWVFSLFHLFIRN